MTKAQKAKLREFVGILEDHAQFIRDLADQEQEKLDAKTEKFQESERGQAMLEAVGTLDSNAYVIDSLSADLANLVNEE